MNVIISKANRAIVVPKCGPIASLFPDAPELPQGVVLKHGLPETVLLRRLGYNVPNPMLLYYDWPGPRDKPPFAVQKRTCHLLTTNERAYVLNDMGTGKTKAALWAWDYLYGNGYAGKLLVIAPRSTLNFVWGAELTATLPHRHYQVLGSPNTAMSAKQRLTRLNDPKAEVYVINHDGVKVIEAEIAEKIASGEIGCIVIDELAVFRNPSDRAKLVRRLVQPCRWVWGMTGSPMPHEPTDVWQQARIVTPHTAPERRGHARDLLMTRVTQHIWKPKPDAIEKAFAMLQPAVRFTMDDVIELPDMVYRTIDVDMTPRQAKAYELVAREFQAMVDGKQITAVNAAVAMGKLLQIAAGWIYAGTDVTGTVKQVVKLDNDFRETLLLELLEGCARKVIVFGTYRHVVDGLGAIFGKAKIKHGVVHGDVHNRDVIFNDFQNNEDGIKVLLAHPQCMAHGLTLTAADTVIWYCPTLSLEIYDQANARIRRIGQQHKQQIIHLQSSPVEKKIYALLRAHANVQEKLLDMFETASERQ